MFWREVVVGGGDRASPSVFSQMARACGRRPRFRRHFPQSEQEQRGCCSWRVLTGFALASSAGRPGPCGGGPRPRGVLPLVFQGVREVVEADSGSVGWASPSDFSEPARALRKRASASAYFPCFSSVTPRLDVAQGGGGVGFGQRRQPDGQGPAVQGLGLGVLPLDFLQGVREVVALVACRGGPRPAISDGSPSALRANARRRRTSWPFRVVARLS